MEQFSLEKYLKNPERKIITRTGIPVRIICTNRKSENCPIIALIQDDADNYEGVYYYTIDGKWVIRGCESMDLFFAPTKRKGWINIYKNDITGAIFTTGIIYSSKDDALENKVALSAYIGSDEIEWEE